MSTTMTGETDDAVQILTAQPSLEQLKEVLCRFKTSSVSPSSSTAAIIFVLVNTTLPELWRSLRSQPGGAKEIVQLFVDCLSNISGVNALLMQLQRLDAENQQEAAKNKALVEDVLEVLSLILEGEIFCPSNVIKQYSQDGAKGKMLLAEYTTLVSGSKILNVVSKAGLAVENNNKLWICDGKKYSQWLGTGIGQSIRDFCDIEITSTLLGKAMTLGYPHAVLEGLLPQILTRLLLLGETLQSLRRTSNLLFAKQLLSYMEVKYLSYNTSRDGPRWWDVDRSRVGAVAGILHELYAQRRLTEILLEAIKNNASIQNLAVQRSTVLALRSIGSNYLDTLLDHLLAVWSDKGYITHTPISAQEVNTQMLLNCFAQSSSSRRKAISVSPLYNEGLSNHLSASIDHVRFLGMIVGEALSRKVDPEGRRLTFKVPETENVSAESWRSLIDIDDELAPVKELQAGIIEETKQEEKKDELPMMSAEEFLVDENEDLDKDLRIYAVPDSDVEDSDEDPTLVSREKTPIPLYIRDLMKYLQSDKYEKILVGLKTAPDLIRRKASFGTELSDQAVDLARILVGLQDTFQMEKFQDMRQAALIALTASAAETVAPYLTNVFFTGDISIQQRCILLSALGIGARELAGLEQKELPPPQLLPPTLHQQYVSPMDQLSLQLEAAMIEPLREEAVTKTSGPEVLQVNRRANLMKARRTVKPNVNALSKIAGRYFVLPLIGRWWIYQQDYGGRGLLSEPIVLSTFIRTIALIMHASAPSALDLREMTREYWDLLLSLRSLAGDPLVLEAILFGMLAILEITEPRHAAENYPKQVVETQAWGAEIFQRMEEGKPKMLAGGILMKIKEIVTKHERLLLGDIISFGSISSAPMGLNLR